MVLQDFVPSCILPSVLSPSNRCNLSCVPEQTNSLTTESAFVCLALFSHSTNCKNSTTEPSLRIVSRWCFSDNAGSRYALLPVGWSGSGEEDIQPAQGSRSARVDGYRGRGDGEHQRLVSTVECVWTSITTCDTMLESICVFSGWLQAWRRPWWFVRSWLQLTRPPAAARRSSTTQTPGRSSWCPSCWPTTGRPVSGWDWSPQACCGWTSGEEACQRTQVTHSIFGIKSVCAWIWCKM